MGALTEDIELATALLVRPVIGREGLQPEVLTTCATDYVTWRNDLPPGVERINGVELSRYVTKGGDGASPRQSADLIRVSAGDRLIDTPREELAKTIWSEVAGNLCLDYAEGKEEE